MKWKICGEFNRRVHLKNKGDAKTLCGRPQENYDTAEGEYAMDYVQKIHGIDLCKTCKSNATTLELIKK